ncbi:rho guanine nucleotide exchange factor 7-like isoform X2 [Apostichopus japonicus]|uniref:rho guanine nucleotide exchange factor 7-like isoform X2 n=1 Tax=Stichopus japonicus TaxID=307972 RepID=UPI003AB2AB32
MVVKNLEGEAMDFFQGIKKVRARFNFPGTGEDELAFSKGDIITVTQIVDGGWWEGMMGESFGWFPSNYVKDTSGPGSPSKSPKKDKEKLDDSNLEKNEYQDQVLKNILETDKEYCVEMKRLIQNYLMPLQTAGVLPATDQATLLCNLVELLKFQETFSKNLEEVSNLAGRHRKVGVCYMKASTEYKSIYSAYCSNHPKTAAVLTKYLEELSRYMEGKGSDIMALTTGLYKPFRLTEKYPNDLMELERHTPVEHPDRINITTSISVYKDICKNCQFVRKQKEIELDIMTGTVQGWEGEPISNLGEIVKMIQGSSQDGGSRQELLILLFVTHLVVLHPTKSMSGYIYQHKFPIATVLANSLPDTETQLGAFELSGPGMDQTTVTCSSLMDREDMVEAIQAAQKVTGGNKVPKLRNVMVPPPIPITQATKRELSPNTLSPRLVPSDMGKSATLPSPRTAKSINSSKSQSLTPPSSPATLTSVGFRPSAPIHPTAVWSMKLGDPKNPTGKKKGFQSTKRKDKPKAAAETPSFLRPERRQEEDNQILQVIEAYCFSNGKRNTMIPNATIPPDTKPHVYLAEDEKIIVEETRGNQTVVEEKSLIDTVYALRDQVTSLMEETKTLKKDLDQERKARRKLESSVRKSMKSMDFKATIPDL